MKKTSIGLINPKSPANVGSVMRAAGNFQVDSVFYTGTRYDRAVQLNTTTENLSRKVGQTIPLSKTTCLISMADKNKKIICIEFAENAMPLTQYQHPDNALYIFGPEDGSIEQSIIDKADAVVYIPTVGCMNLAATVNVVLYDRLSKSSCHITDNDLIYQNRDSNNNLKVKSRL